MTADVINLNSILVALEQLRESDPICTLRYYPTQNEFRNKAWREWFAKTYPTVILMPPQEPIPT